MVQLLPSLVVAGVLLVVCQAVVHDQVEVIFEPICHVEGSESRACQEERGNIKSNLPELSFLSSNSLVLYTSLTSDIVT